MKIWNGHGSEHSARLVMIGRFSGPEQARATEARFKRLQSIAEECGERDWEDPDERLSDELSQALTQMRLYSFTRDDVENFRYDHGIARRGDELEITTDEVDVLGFLKLMLSDGAKLEIYSRDSWTRDGPSEARADADPDYEAGPVEE